MQMAGEENGILIPLAGEPEEIAERFTTAARP
jgi:hypothetical protein